ncbi:MAG TPA: hypothetical protein ENG45_01980, partial [Candidatus Aenigmarchaeota archaeon]|nr:hypothetical protein [Candidatus Aenigmarchaeota archaeon]
LLIPGVYQYELIEIKYPKSVWNITGVKPAIYADYEPYWGRRNYASNTGGAFYAGEVGVLEFLCKIKRQASILIIREVTEDYNVPVGIWQMQEAVRGAFNIKPEKFDNLDSALRRIMKKLKVSSIEIYKVSKLLKILLKQRKLTKYLKKG